MKIKIQKQIFRDEQLRHVLTKSPKDKEVSKKSFVTNLLQASKKEELIRKYIECLGNQRETYHCRIAAGLVKDLSKEIKKKSKRQFSSDLLARIQQVSKSLVCGKKPDNNWQQDKKMEKVIKEEIEKIRHHKIRCGQFHGETIPVAKFNKLAKDLDRLEAMKVKIDVHCKQDRNIQKKREFLSGLKNTTDPKENRFMHKEGQLKNNQKMILISAPKRYEIEIKKYWEMVIKKESPLLISLCSPCQWKTMILPFYRPEVVAGVAKELKKETGVSLKHKETKVLYEGQDEIIDKGRKKKVKILERVYSLKDKDGVERHVTHLHYRHWPNRYPIPDQVALDILIKRREELVQDLDSPIVINCQGGKGRTGLLAIFECCKNEINNQIVAGKPLDKITINLPEMIYGMRRFAPNIIEGEEEKISRYVQACQLIYGYYKKRVEELSNVFKN